MKKQTGWIEVAAVALLLALALGVAWALAAYSCGARWARSGLQADYALGQGCLVRMPSGRWVPDRAVRDIDLGGQQEPAKQAEIPK